MVKEFDAEGGLLTTVLTLYFMGGLYEETESVATKYYAIAGMTLAMKDASGMKYLLTDHLGSVDVVTDANGNLLSQQRYLPFGEVRTDDFAPGTISQTDFAYTGQRDLPDLGLMDYKARFYDAALARFTQPDSIIPNLADPQSWNRYTYVVNDPVRFADPTGQRVACGAMGEQCEGNDAAWAPTKRLNHKNNVCPNDSTACYAAPPRVTASGLMDPWTPRYPYPPRTWTTLPLDPMSRLVLSEALPSVDGALGTPSKVVPPVDSRNFAEALANAENGLKVLFRVGVTAGPTITDYLYNGQLTKDIVGNAIRALGSSSKPGMFFVMPMGPDTLRLWPDPISG